MGNVVDVKVIQTLKTKTQDKQQNLHKSTPLSVIN